jgi:hypothetical protein
MEAIRSSESSVIAKAKSVLPTAGIISKYKRSKAVIHSFSDFQFPNVSKSPEILPNITAVKTKNLNKRSNVSALTLIPYCASATCFDSACLSSDNFPGILMWINILIISKKFVAISVSRFIFTRMQHIMSQLKAVVKEVNLSLFLTN